MIRGLRGVHRGTRFFTPTVRLIGVIDQPAFACFHERRQIPSGKLDGQPIHQKVSLLSPGHHGCGKQQQGDARCSKNRSHVD